MALNMNSINLIVVTDRAESCKKYCSKSLKYKKRAAVAMAMLAEFVMTVYVILFAVVVVYVLDCVLQHRPKRFDPYNIVGY